GMGAYTLPGASAQVVVSASMPGYQPVAESLDWDSARGELSVPATVRYLEVESWGWGGAGSGRGFRVIVRLLRLQDRSDHPTYRTYLRNLRFGLPTPQDGVDNGSTRLILPGPRLSVRDYPIRLG